MATAQGEEMMSRGREQGEGTSQEAHEEEARDARRARAVSMERSTKDDTMACWQKQGRGKGVQYSDHAERDTTRGTPEQCDEMSEADAQQGQAEQHEEAADAETTEGVGGAGEHQTKQVRRESATTAATTQLTGRQDDGQHDAEPREFHTHEGHDVHRTAEEAYTTVDMTAAQRTHATHARLKSFGTGHRTK